jgi:hypothetical protein
MPADAAPCVEPHSRPRLGALPAKYSFVLNQDSGARFTRCPRCDAHTRVRKLPLVIHVDRRDGPSLLLLGKTRRLCVVCEVLVAHEAEITGLLAAAGVSGAGETPSYVVLGTVARRVWRAGLIGGGALDEVRARMADFREHLRVEVAPGGWYRDTSQPGANAPRSKPVKLVR